MKTKFKDNHYKKHLEIFYKKHNLKCSNGFAILSNIACDDFYEFNDIENKIYFNFDYKDKGFNRKSNIVKTINLNFNILKNKCKLYNKFISDDCIIHFGNTEGCDYMKGENLIVAGTPHFDETVYKLIATHLGIDANERMRFSEVEDSCYKYWIHTYENKDLRTIQMWLIKTELVQAVGRARLLRYDCTVKLYASIREYEIKSVNTDLL